MKFNKVAKLISLACGGVVALSTPAYAVENEDDSVERIEVTGSRLKRVDMEGATPVTTITAEDMAVAGFSTVGDALRASTLNSFGSYGGTANNSWSSQATIQLKGASASDTLVLLDGQRMAKSPVLGGAAANINTIPTSAIERIEILSDGASAIYGTDAVAGVVNVILKKSFEGIEFKARAEQAEAEGGDNHSFSFTGGLTSENGNLVFTMEHYKKD
ncbi:TonB-dependent receptor plug domain-containing protein, partial [Shewanella sp. 0m-11]